MNDLLVVMETIAKDLKELVNALKSTLPQPQIQQPQPPPTPTLTPEEIRRIEDVRMMFPSELGDLLAFEEKEDYIIVRPRQYLGGENFAKIASIVRGAGGEYISAGKESHFRIPKKSR
ncbi:MAG TPA: hypothetical protein ENF63_01675 [Candidatus Bathyarchaeota archaeon]|nr:hypothetical protein [Candidatus Bathyarchaeota archaeon]